MRVLGTVVVVLLVVAVVWKMAEKFADIMVAENHKYEETLQVIYAKIYR